jgi:hypothetical protein
MLGEIGEVIVAVQLVVGAAEEKEEILVAGQVLDRGELQAENAEMAAVEIDGVDVSRFVDEIIENVTATGGDGEHPAFRGERERLEVDPGIFPNLVVDETIEPESEEPLRNSFRAQGVIVVDCAFQILGCGGVHVFGKTVGETKGVVET